MDDAVSIAGPPQPRLFLYSGHDTTIMPLLVTLGVKVDDWPDYNSSLVKPFLPIEKTCPTTYPHPATKS